MYSRRELPRQKWKNKGLGYLFTVDRERGSDSQQNWAHTQNDGDFKLQ